MMRLTNIKRLDAEVSYPLFVSLGGETRLFTLGRIVYSLFNIIKNNTNSLLRTNHAIYAGGLPAESPCFWIFFAQDAKEDTASAPRKVRTISLRGLRVPLHGLISRVFNTDSLHIAYISHNRGSVSSSLPSFPFLTIYKTT